MTPDERRRAGRAVEQRMTDLGCTIAELAHKAGVDRKTVRALIAGRPTSTRTRQAVAKALDWPPGEMLRRAVLTTPIVRGGTALDAFSTIELLEEILRRAVAFEDLANGKVSGGVTQLSGSLPGNLGNGRTAQA